MTVNTITVGPGKLTIGAQTDLTNFSAQVTTCKAVPNVSQSDAIPVLSGESVAGDRSESWTLEGTLLQDLGAAASTTEWLFEHRGETHAFEYVPATAAGKAMQGSLVVEAIEIGGDVKTKPTSDFKWTMVGDPTLGAPSV